MNLKVIKKTVFEVEYYDLEKLIQDTYNITEYSIPAVEEVGNDVSLPMDIRKEPLISWEADRVNDVKAGKEVSFSLHAVMQDLCNTGILDEGEYLVHISW